MSGMGQFKNPKTFLFLFCWRSFFSENRSFFCLRFKGTLAPGVFAGHIHRLRMSKLSFLQSLLLKNARRASASASGATASYITHLIYPDLVYSWPGTVVEEEPNSRCFFA